MPQSWQRSKFYLRMLINFFIKFQLVSSNQRQLKHDQPTHEKMGERSYDSTFYEFLIGLHCAIVHGNEE